MFYTFFVANWRKQKWGLPQKFYLNSADVVFSKKWLPVVVFFFPVFLFFHVQFISM